jgi:hypothetical protein
MYLIKYVVKDLFHANRDKPPYPSQPAARQPNQQWSNDRRRSGSAGADASASGVAAGTGAAIGAARASRGAASNLNKKFAAAPKSEKPTGTPNQVFSFLTQAKRNAPQAPSENVIKRREGLQEGMRLA